MPTPSKFTVAIKSADIYIKVSYRLLDRDSDQEIISNYEGNKIWTQGIKTKEGLNQNF